MACQLVSVTLPRLEKPAREGFDIVKQKQRLLKISGGGAETSQGCARRMSIIRTASLSEGELHGDLPSHCS